MAKQLNSESGKQLAHNKWAKPLSIGVLGWETTRLNQEGPRQEMPNVFQYFLHRGKYFRSL